MSKFLKGGVPRDIKLNGNPYAAAQDEKLTYMLSGRGGPVAIDGNGEPYQESNPLLGGFNITLSVDEDEFQTLEDMRKSGVKIVGYFTTASNTTFNVSGGISSDTALENDNGTVSIEFRGKVEPQ